MPNLEGKRVLVVGYALTGKSVVDFLLERKAQVTLTALEDLSKDAEIAFYKRQGLEVIDKGHPLELLNQDWDFMVKNPGIPYHIPFIQTALDQHIPIYTDVEVAGWFHPGRLIGVTGSNGKTTTTQLIYEIFQKVDHYQTYLAGNIGVPMLESVSRAGEKDTLVAELSSFQLAGTQQLHPNIAVITNIYQAHLDYHGSVDRYRKAKLKLVQNMQDSDVIVYNYDQDGLHNWLANNSAQQIPVAMVTLDDYVKTCGIYSENGKIYYQGQSLMSISQIPIPGDHNVMNVMMAVAATIAASIPVKDIIDGVIKYQGVAHRIQPIAQSQGRRFYNDSKATNTVATITALKSFQEPIIYIGGGLDRGNGFDDLVPYGQSIQKAFLFGETKEKLKTSLEKIPGIHIQLADNLEEATRQAYHVAQEGQVVLFSPACASWDQFDNFEIRGQCFTELIHQLIRQTPYN